MVSGLLAVVAVAVVLATFGQVSAGDDVTFQSLLEESIKVPMERDNFDATDYQLEGRVAREFLGNQTFDDQYMSMFIESLDAVGLTAPNKADFVIQLAAEGVAFSDDEYDELSINSEFSYAINMMNYQSCPRTQYYGCRSIKYKMPCSSMIVDGAQKHCCPIHPANIAIKMAYCNCCNCALLSEFGVQCGHCARRYKYERILFACFNESRSNWELTRHYINYPHSCYCNAH